MPLEVGSVVTRLTHHFDGSGAERYDRETAKLRRESKKDIVTQARVDPKTDGVDRYERKLHDVDRAHGDLVRGSARVRTGLGSLFIGGAGGAAAVLGFGFLEKGVKGAFDAYKESERVGKQTNAVLKSTGNEAGVSAKHVGDLATAISKKTGIDDEAIQSGENLLLTFTNIRNEAGKGNDIFDQSTKVLTDMSAALGQDTKSSAIQLGKALNDPIKGVTALQRVGVSFTAQQKDQIKTLVNHGKTLDAQKLILRELNKEFGGSAAATATNSKRLSVAFGNLAEGAGKIVSPIIEKATGALNKFVNGMVDGSGAGGRFLADAKRVWNGVRGAVGDALHFANSIIQENRKRIDSIGDHAGQLWGTIKKAFNGIVGAFRDTFGGGSGTTRDVRQIIKEVLKIADVVLSVYGTIARRALPGIIQAFRGAFTVIRGIIKVLSGLLTGDFGKAWDGVKDIFKGALKGVVGLLKAATTPMRLAGAAVGHAIEGALSSAWSRIVGTARGFVNDIIDVLDLIPGVHIGHVGSGGGSGASTALGTHQQNLGGTGHLAQGGKVTMPVAIMGEEAPEHPEWVIPTNPAYRQRAVGLWMQAAKELGIPGFALGGVLDFAKSLPGRAVRTLGGMESWLEDKLPGNPGGVIGGGFDWAKNKAVDFIENKAAAVFQSVKNALAPPASAGGGGGNVHGLLPPVLRAIAFARAHGWGGGIVSGWRSRAEQAILYARYLAGGTLAARPGTSNHEGGEAIDVSDTEGFARAMAQMGAGQLYRRIPGEPWHFSITGYRKGGKRGKGTPKPVLSHADERGIQRSIARGDRGITDYETSIQGMERVYGQRDREFGLSDEDLLIENDDGSSTPNTAGINHRLGELDKLTKLRRQIKHKNEAYRHAVQRLIKRYRDAIKTLQHAIKAAKGKARAKERGGYRQLISDYRSRIGDLKGVFRDLGGDIEDSRIDLEELGGERASVAGTTGQAASDSGAGDSGGDAGGGDGATPDQTAIASQATARADQLQEALGIALGEIKAFGGAGDIGIYGPGGAPNALAAATGQGAPGVPGFAGAGPGAGDASPGAGGDVHVHVGAFVTPSGAQLADLGSAVVQAIGALPSRKSIKETVG